MYLNLIQIAESFGVSEKVVEGWIRDEGLPHTPDRGVLLFDRAQVAQLVEALVDVWKALDLPFSAPKVVPLRPSASAPAACEYPDMKRAAE